MTATSSDRMTAHKDGELIAVPIAAATKVLAGTIACANATGFAVGGDTALNLTYIGTFDETIDNLAGGDGAAQVMVRRGKAFHLANDGTDPVTQAGLGKPCYIVDNQTVAATDGGGTRSASGIVLGIESGGVWVL